MRYNNTTETSKDNNQPFWTLISVESMNIDNSQAKSFVNQNKNRAILLTKKMNYI